MKERKMVSIPADTHLALFEYLVEQEKQTGLKITASSFAENAIKNAIERGGKDVDALLRYAERNRKHEIAGQGKTA